MLERWGQDLLDKTISSTTSSFLLLKLNKLKLTKGFENVLQILFSNAEVDVSNIEAMEGNGVVIASRGLWVAGLSVLLCLSELSNNGDSKKLLSGHLNCEWDGVFVLELDVADTGDN